MREHYYYVACVNIIIMLRGEAGPREMAVSRVPYLGMKCYTIELIDRILLKSHTNLRG